MDEERRQWCRVRSHLLNERVLVVFDKAHLKEARRAHSDLVIYFPVEMRELRGMDPETLKQVHAAKRHLGGWVLPPDHWYSRQVDALWGENDV